MNGENCFRTAIYTRLSDEDENKQNPEDESHSIQNQKSMLIEYAMGQGWNIAGIYSDDDYGGGSVDRPDFQRMLADCEAGKIDIVLCKTQSRFSRDMEVIERYLHNKFITWNVRFVSIVDHADTAVKGNKKARQINGLVNDWYLEELSDNIKQVIHFKKQKGENTASFAPYGYLIDPEDKHRLIPDPDAVEHVRKIFQLYTDGYGYSRIAGYLTENGIPTPSKLKLMQGSRFVCCHAPGGSDAWNKDTVRKILMNEVYTGNLVQGKVENLDYKDPRKRRNKGRSEWIVVEGTHEPIIDKATWESVHSKFTGRRPPRTAYSTGKVHVFSRKVYCMECGKAMTRNICHTTRQTLAYLACRTHRNNPAQCANSRLLRYDHLEAIVLDELNKLIAQYMDKQFLHAAIEEQYGCQPEQKQRLANLERERERLKLSLGKKADTLKSLYIDKENGLITIDEFTLLKHGWNEDMHRIKASLGGIEGEIQRLRKSENEDGSIKATLHGFNGIKTLDRNILDSYIDSIYVGAVDDVSKKRRIKIMWKI